MFDPDNMQSGKLCVGEELTKVTVVEELSNAMDFLKRCSSFEQSTPVCIDFIKLKRVDTLAVVFIVQIERFVARSSKGFKITYQNLPGHLTSLLNLTSIAQAIFIDE